MKAMIKVMMCKHKGIITVLLSVVFTQLSAQATFQSIGGGAYNWSATAKWVLKAGSVADDDAPFDVPDGDDNVEILTGHTINLNTASACNDLDVTGTLQSNSTSILTVNGNLSSNAGSIFTRSSGTMTINVAGNYTVNAGGVSDHGRYVLSVAGNTTVNGTLQFSNATGAKTLGNATDDVLTINNGGSLNFTAAVTLTVNGDLSTEGGSSIAGSATGVMTISDQLTVNNTGTTTVGRVTITIQGNSQIDGTLLFSVNTGTKTFGNAVTDVVTVGNGGAINFSAAVTLAVTGDLTLDGGSSLNNGGASTGIITVTDQLTVNNGGTSTVGNVTITIQGNTQIDGTLLHNNTSGTKTFGNAATDAVTISSTGSVDFTAAETMAITGTLTTDGGASITGSSAIGILTVSSTLTVNNTGITTIGGVTITITGATNINGTLELNNTSGTKTFTGDVTIAGTGTFNNSGNEAVSMAGSLTNNGGTFTSGTGAYTFSGATKTWTSTGGSMTFSGAVSVAGTRTNTVTNMTITGNLSGAGTLTNQANCTIHFAGSVTITGLTATANPNTIEYNGSGAQTAKATTYHNLIINNSAPASNVTATGTFTINNNVDIQDGTVDVGAFTVAGNLSISNGAIANIAGVTVAFNGNSTIAGRINITNATGNKNFGNAATDAVTISSTGLIDFTAAETMAITGTLTTDGGASITGSSAIGIVTVSSIFTINNTGITTIGGVTITITGATNINGTLELNNTSGTKTFTGDVTIAGTGTFNNSGNEAVSMAGSLTNNGGTFTSGTGAYTFSGAAKTWTSTGGSMTFSGAVSVAGTRTNTVTDMTITGNLTGAGTLTNQANCTLHLAGSATITGLTATANPNTIEYDGSGAQTVKATTYHNLIINNSALASNVTATGTYSVNNDMDIQDGTVNLGSVTVTNAFTTTNGTVVNVAGVSPTVNGSTSIAGTINFTSTTGTKTFTNLTIFNTGNWNPTVNESFTLNGNFTNNGTFTPLDGTYTFGGTSVINSVSNITFGDMAISDAAAVSLSSPVKLKGTITLNGTGSFTTNNNFTLLSTSTYTGRIATLPDPANFIGNITMQRFTLGSGAGTNSTGWVFLGSPVTGMTFNDLDDDIYISCADCPDGYSGNFTNVYNYNESAGGTFSNGFVKLSSINDAIEDGRGYWVYVGQTKNTAGDTTIDVTGVPIKGNVSLPVTYNDDTGQPASEDGWNLISNPYPSPISWALLLANAGTPANIDDAIYVWNADLNGGLGNYASYVGGVSSPVVGSGGIGNTIPSWQAFYVHLTGSTTLDATESVKIAGNPTFLRVNTHEDAMALKPNLFRISLAGQQQTDETVIRLHSNATLNFDKNLDAFKRQNDNLNAINIATVMNNESYVINSIPELAADHHVSMKVLVKVKGSYSIQVKDFSEFMSSACVILEDKYTGSMHDLRSGAYNCTLYDTTITARFIVHINIPVEQKVFNSKCPSAKDGMIIAKGSGSGPWTYEWKDVNSNTIKTSSNKSTEDTLSGLAAGTYYLAIIGTSGSCGSPFETFIIENSLQAQFASSSDTLDLSVSDLVEFTDQSKGAVYYHWDFGDGDTSELMSPQHVFNKEGKYTVTLTVSDGYCSDTYSKDVIITNVLGLKKHNNKDVTTYYANNTLHIVNNRHNYVQYKVYNTLGQVIKTGSLTNPVTDKINVEGIPCGIYMIDLYDLKGNAKTCKWYKY